MKDIYYINSQNDKLDLLSPPYMLQTGDIFDYSWNYDKGGFTRDTAEKTLLLSILNSGRQKYYEAIDHFAEVTEIDVLEKRPGRLYVGEFYLKCNIHASTKSEWENDIELLDNEIALVTDHPFWIREHPHLFKASEVTSTNNKRYPGRYAYRYANGLNNTKLVNPHYAEANFILRIYGPCVKPSVYIGGYEYHVEIILEAGEYLEIDSTEETVTKIMLSGIRVNSFHYRSFANSIFRPIPPGEQDVSWDGSFDFDLILFEERSEPRWS